VVVGEAETALRTGPVTGERRAVPPGITLGRFDVDHVRAHIDQMIYNVKILRCRK